MKLLLIVTFTIVGLAIAGDKNGIRVEKDTGELYVLVSTKKEGKYEPGATRGTAFVYLRVQNTSDHPATLNLKGFYLRTTDGKALQILSIEEAAARAPLIVQPMLRLNRPTLSGNTMMQFPDQAIPPKSYREGLLIFEGTGDAGNQKQPVTLHLPGLLNEPIPINW